MALEVYDLVVSRVAKARYEEFGQCALIPPCGGREVEACDELMPIDVRAVLVQPQRSGVRDRGAARVLQLRGRGLCQGEIDRRFQHFQENIADS